MIHEHVGPIDCDMIDDFAVQPLSTIHVPIPWDMPLSPLFIPRTDLPNFPCIIDPQEFMSINGSTRPGPRG